VVTASAKPVASAKPKKTLADCKPGAVVAFDDELLEKTVRRQLRKSSGKITKTELAKVKTLDLSQAKSNDQLDPCLYPHFTGLKGLYLARGKLDDLKPLEKLTQLESLRIAATRVTDLAPLAGMTKLDRLDLGRAPVTSLKPLAGLVNLTNLMLDRTEVSDLTPLANMKKLKVLNLKSTRVSDLSPLKNLPALEQLYIEGSLVKDTSVLSASKKLHIHE